MTSSSIEWNGESKRQGPFSIKSMNLIEKAFRDVSREEWKARIGDMDMMYLLEDHVSSMKGMLSDLNYETYCVDRLIENTAKMDVTEAENYVNLVESIAFFYSKTLGKDVATALITGLIMRAKDVKGVERYYNNITYNLGRKITVYGSRISRLDSRLEVLNNKLKKNSTGLLRFFKKEKVKSIKDKIKAVESKSDRTRERLKSTAGILDKVKR